MVRAASETLFFRQTLWVQYDGGVTGTQRAFESRTNEQGPDER